MLAPMAEDASAAKPTVTVLDVEPGEVDVLGSAEVTFALEG